MKLTTPYIVLKIVRLNECILLNFTDGWIQLSFNKWQVISNKQYMNLYCVYMVYNLFDHFHAKKLFWTIRIMWSYVDTISACLIVKLPQVYPFYKTFPSYLMLVTWFDSFLLISAPNIVDFAVKKKSVAVEETQYGI